jgi:type II secretory pathway component GspD/PulD (secretin)
VVGNAQTLVIGGLIKDSSKKNHFKVPVLGDIPLLGYLFKTEYLLAQKTELLILVSATIVDSKEQARMKREYDRVGNRVKRTYDKGTNWERAKKRAVESAIADPRTQEMAELSRQIEQLAQERKSMETNIAKQEQEVKELRKQKQALEDVKKKVK